MIAAMQMEDFTPRCMATALPTMPHRDPAEAARVMLEYFPEAPSVPRLSMSARMFMEGMPCLVIDAEKKRLTFDLSKEKELQQFYEKYLEEDLKYFAISEKYGPGFHALLDLCRKSGSKDLKLIHTQMPGVVTWGLSMNDTEGKPAWYNEIIRDVLIKTLIMKARWQEGRLKEALPGVKTLVTLGEPTLGVINSPFGSISDREMISALDEIFQQVAGFSCVHCCANMDWSQLMRSQTRVINFDAYQFSEKIALYPKEMRDFLHRGGMLAWGIVPVDKELLASVDEKSLVAKLEEGVACLVGHGFDKKFLLARSFITPCCTTANLFREEAEKAFRLTREISRIMRETYLS